MIRFRPTVAEIDLGAVRHNVGVMRSLGMQVMAVVKSDGYGHGAVPVANAAVAAGAAWLGVALVEEGLALREGGVTAPILVLSEFPPGSEKDALAGGLTPTVYSDAGVEGVAQAAQALGVSARIHVKVDTGMHRVGVYPPEAARDLVGRAAASGCELGGLWTHLARSEEDVPTTGEQLERFRRVVAGVRGDGFEPGMVHAANSAAAIRFPESRLDVVRAGIVTYGLLPAPDVGADLGLRPALSWRSAVTSVRRLPAGEAVSYGHRYRLDREATIATVPVGYADGYPRALSNRAAVLIHGRRFPVAGTITMDQLLVDCGDEPVAPGDEVVLIGRQGNEALGAQELADLAGTIPYEIVCGISDRVPRDYVDGSAS